MATVSLGNLSKQKPLAGRTSSQSATNSRSGVRASLTTALMMASDVSAVLLALGLALNLELERFLGASASLRSVVTRGTPLSWQLGYLACYIAALLLVSHHQGLYGHTLSYSALHEQRRTVQSGLIAGLLLCGALYTLHGAGISRDVVLCLICLTTIFTCISRATWRFLMFRRFERGIDSSNVVIIGATGIGLALQKQIVNDRHLGRVFKGFVHLSEEGFSQVSPTPDNCLGSLDQLR